QSRGGTSPAGRSRYPSRATRQFRELVTPLPCVSSTANRGTPSPTTASPAGSSQRSENYVSCQLGLFRVGAHASHPRRRVQRREASWELTEMRELPQLSASQRSFEAQDKRRSGEKRSVIHCRESRRASFDTRRPSSGFRWFQW